MKDELSADDNNAERWEAYYVAQDIPWDKNAPSPSVYEVLNAPDFSGPTLVPGCGLGHDVAAIAKAGHAVVGLDYSASGMEQARALYPEIATQFVTADLFTYEGQFKSIFEHTCFCAVHPAHREAYVQAVHRLLQPDGMFFGVLYVTDEPEEVAGPPYKIPRGEILDWFTPLFEVVWERSPRESFSSRRGSELLVQLRPAK
jgi:SAM-dependent methyltransferase